MAKYSEAQAKAVKKYLEKNGLVNLNFRVPGEFKEKLKKIADEKNKSVTAYIIDLVEQDIQNDTE